MIHVIIYALCNDVVYYSGQILTVLAILNHNPLIPYLIISLFSTVTVIKAQKSRYSHHAVLASILIKLLVPLTYCYSQTDVRWENYTLKHKHQYNYTTLTLTAVIL